ncbi:hypothetical protein [Paenibacillus sp. IHBB 10380]|uniref:hypothetical protein n=1 Tax=Paenibacillus sp. IHBB 10380 TaxID=1566358 RepID=UPI0005CFB66D|nr:hypothetical protein [Paenibacillus sp. IHBB 10380]AJS59224.1 hypothetical protein UB51_12955 [Paenibacillus sp. IHBB 10380]
MKKYIVSLLSAALISGAFSAVSFADSPTNSTRLESLANFTQSIGATSGWQTKNNIRARVYTDATSYGPGSRNINVTVEKSTVGAASYQIYVTSPTGTGGINDIYGTIGSSPITHTIPISSLLPINEQGTFTVMLKVYQYANYDVWLGDWEIPSFPVIRTN